MYEIICLDKYGNSIDELVQWDINRILYINWEHNCTPIFQFGNTKSDRLLVVKGRIIEDDTKMMAEVNVPNILLQQPYPILGFVYLETEVDGDEGYFTGKTVYNFKIPVKKKTKPEDYKYQENTEYISWINLEAEAKTFIAELEVETNRFKAEYEDTLGTAKENADKAIQSASKAKESEINAKISETNANISEANAKHSEVAAEESEVAAKLSEENAHDSEVASKLSEENALSSENNAKYSEDAAKLSETNAKISEINAKVSETNADESEANAKESEEKASISENNARILEANAKISETNAKNSENASKESENKAKNSEDAAKISEEKAKESETNSKASEKAAKKSEDNAKISETNAKTSERNAKESENKAKVSETNAKQSEDAVKISESNAKTSEINAKESEEKAASSISATKNWAILSQSYAIGNTNTRDDEDIDNSKYYCERTQNIYNSIGGVFTPKGSISFDELSTVEKQTGYVYHITDSFVTDETFKCGSGVFYSSATNVYYTIDGYWDCFSGRYVSDNDFATLLNTIDLLEKRIKAMEDVTVLEIVE